MDLKELLLENYKTVEQELEGKNGSVVKERRKEAIATFEKIGFPTLKNEEWKYTNISAALKKEFSIETIPALTKADIEQYLIKNLKGNILVFVNGQLSQELSKIISPESGLIIKPLAETDADVLEKYFGKSSTNDAFTYLNTALSHQGTFIKIPKGKSLEEPVVLYFISDARKENIFIQPHNIFLIEENAEAKFVESYHTIGKESGFSNVITQIILRKDARAEYYKIQNDSVTASHVGTTQVYQEGKSNFSSTTVSLNGNIIRNNLNIVLNAEHSEATMYGLYLLKGTQHVDNHTIADHAKPNCFSNELYKGILNDKSTGVFNGKIFVKQDAQKTNAFQSNKNILLSKDATMNTKPQLEIFADDVKCSHGATIGQLDEEPLFYLRSRGISEEKAKALLVIAFAQDIIDHIKIEALKEFLIRGINQSLGNNF
ncbi:MAG: Fe-S cluster assembly protein SufD [Cytophagaceae bacterium]|nr:Fe-S cluster assembly protein SufD [Cytophagaceae bacterium]